MAFEFRRLSVVLLMAALPVAFGSCSSTPRDPSVNAGANRADVYPDITAIVETCLAVSSGSRSGSFRTLV